MNIRRYRVPQSSLLSATLFQLDINEQRVLTPGTFKCADDNTVVDRYLTNA